MRRYLSVVLALACAAALTSCGRVGDEAAPPAMEKSAAATPAPEAPEEQGVGGESDNIAKPAEPPPPKVTEEEPAKVVDMPTDPYAAAPSGAFVPSGDPTPIVGTKGENAGYAALGDVEAGDGGGAVRQPDDYRARTEGLMNGPTTGATTGATTTPGLHGAKAGEPEVILAKPDAKPDDARSESELDAIVDGKDEEENTAREKGKERPKFEDDAEAKRDDRDGRAGKRLSQYARRDGDLSLVRGAEDPERMTPPERVLPRTFYFENTYLGGSAAYAERLRRLDSALAEGDRHYQRVKAEAQPFDAPPTDGLAVTASVDATHIDGAQRVFLQVGLRGSDRYGWRRPPLDVVLVIDRAAFEGGPAVVSGFIVDLLRKLGSADRFGIVVADGEPSTFLELGRIQSAQQHLARRMDALAAPSRDDANALARAMARAGAMLAAASDDEAVVPGSQTVLVLTRGDGAGRVELAQQAAHELTIQGAVTSVFALDTAESAWWQVANAGYGNFHRVPSTAFGEAIDEELANLARVVARLVRVNVRLGKDVDAIRVLGTRVLDQREVAAVKAREVATDRNLSKSMGIVSDRGEDDDGIQTVIPYFYGDDSHVILIELWVKRPGLVADVTVRYKDMVNLDNATARTSVKLGARPQFPTREQELIARNVRGFKLGESLQNAAIEVRRGNVAGAAAVLDQARAWAATTNASDQKAVEGLRAMMAAPAPVQASPEWRANVGESLLISGQRRVGDTDHEQRER